MGEAFAQADAFQGFFGLFFVGDGMEVLRKHNVFDGVQIRHQVELLEDEANFFGAVADQGVFVEFCEIDAVHYDAAGGECVQAAENIDERGFAGAGWAHQCDPFAGCDVEGDAVQRA